HEGAPVTGIAGTLADGFTLTIGASDREQQSIAARVVLGAWGKRATPDRALGRAFFQRKQPFLALKAHYHGPDTGAAVELHAFAGGYLGLSAIEGGRTNLCLLATETAFRAVGRSPDRLLEHIGRQNPVVAARLHGSERAGNLIAVSQLAFGPKAAVERDVLMLGDAAQLIPPLAGDGMAMALQSAELAAPLVDDFLHGGAALTLTRAYTTDWHHEFQRRLRFARLVQPLFLRPRLLSLGLHLLRATPRLADYLIRATRGPTGRATSIPSQP
ncbi:MAG TPA: hypothetical protein VER55_11975, partial [Ardenticatenaceae bacterium]|nr:hypothetical protein [Ardenticatenaceae bacterium]